jgi:hypothetical protein
MALAPLAVEPAKEHRFVMAFLASCGAALDRASPAASAERIVQATLLGAGLWATLRHEAAR